MAWVRADTQGGYPGREEKRGLLVTMSEEADDSSAKTLLFTDIGVGGHEFEILSVYVEIATTATVGDRTIVVELLDAADDVVMAVEFGAVQAASGSAAWQASPNFAEVAGTYVHREPLPAGFFMTGTHKLKVYDKAAVDAAADDMKVHVTGRVR